MQHVLCATCDSDNILYASIGICPPAQTHIMEANKTWHPLFNSEDRYVSNGEDFSLPASIKDVSIEISTPGTNVR